MCVCVSAHTCAWVFVCTEMHVCVSVCMHIASACACMVCICGLIDMCTRMPEMLALPEWTCSPSYPVCTCNFIRMFTGIRVTGLTEPPRSLAVSPSHLSPWEKQVVLLNLLCQAPLASSVSSIFPSECQFLGASGGQSLLSFSFWGVSYYRLKCLPAGNYSEREFLTFISK